MEFAGRVTQNRDVDTMLGAKARRRRHTAQAAGVDAHPPRHRDRVRPGARPAHRVRAARDAARAVPRPAAARSLYLSIKEGRRKTEFAAQLPGTLQLLSGSLAAGYSLPAGRRHRRARVVRPDGRRAQPGDRRGPARRSDGGRARHGGPADGLGGLRVGRHGDPHPAGGRRQPRRGARATSRPRCASASGCAARSRCCPPKGRLSAIILGALPLLFVVYLVLVRPEYIGLLVTNPLGIVLIVVGVTLLVAGGFWLRKVVTVEV